MSDSEPGLLRHWPLDPQITFLNHGSYGAAPRVVLAAQSRWRERMETEPVRFLARDLEAELDRVRIALGPFLGAEPEALAFVRNATTAINAVLASIQLAPGDEILVTDHEYNAVINATRRWTAASRAEVRIVDLPLPTTGSDEIVERVLAALTPRTRVLLVSHVTSPTAIVMPVSALARELHERGVAVLVDGAHSPGMVPLNLNDLGVDWYAGNLHKWLCAPKGSAFLWTRADRRTDVRPTVTSHGANDTRIDRSRYLLEFDWTGTDDPTGWLAVPDAIAFLEGIGGNGLTALQASMRSVALAGRDLLERELGADRLVPDDGIAAMAAVSLPIDPGQQERAVRLQADLMDRDRIEVPVIDWPVRAARAAGAPPSRWLIRVSCAPYTTHGDLERLAAALRARLGLGRPASPAASSQARSLAAE